MPFSEDPAPIALLLDTTGIISPWLLLLETNKSTALELGVLLPIATELCAIRVLDDKR